MNDLGELDEDDLVELESDPFEPTSVRQPSGCFGEREPPLKKEIMRAAPAPCIPNRISFSSSSEEAIPPAPFDDDAGSAHTLTHEAVAEKMKELMAEKTRLSMEICDLMEQQENASGYESQGLLQKLSEQRQRRYPRGGSSPPSHLVGRRLTGR